MTNERKILSAVILRGAVMLPEKILHFDVSKKSVIFSIEQAMKERKPLFVVAQKDLQVEKPTMDDLYEYGCIIEVKQIIKLPKDIIRILAVGRARAKLVELIDESTILKAEIEETEIISTPLPEQGDLPEEEYTQLLEEMKVLEKAKVRALKSTFTKYASGNKNIKAERVSAIQKIFELKALSTAISAASPLPYMDSQELLDADYVDIQYELLVNKLTVEIEVQELKNRIQNKVKQNFEKTQKEMVLREQMKVIREELGENQLEAEIEGFKEATDELLATKEVKEKLHKEIKRLTSIHSSSAEHAVIRTYIETMLDMPWDYATVDSNDIGLAKQLLDEEHYGLDEVKERILEVLAVRTLTSQRHNPIICLVGPPGTGKTSIARSLASAMEKTYTRISLGGIHDEAEIRGHRKTYIGSMPGRIANGLKEAGTKNPLMLLDEIDKVGRSNKGDAYSALLEVLDGEQNMHFRDHYLEVPMDLSEVLFVATANSLQGIPRPLLDRMEIIEIHSYTENEKVHIAENHLIPKQLELHGLKKQQLVITPAVISKMARNYTKEAGVRQLERKISSICRKVAKELVETKKKRIRITESNVEKYLGQEKYRYKMKNEKDDIGIVRGLAWTSAGGDTLQIEAISMPGKGNVILTGQLGNVMKESATAAISYIRTIAAEYEISDTYFLKHDVHVHIPEGAVPKDGPSAGITMALAILSAVSGKLVRSDVAMTGEVTLRGRVLPIGGLKEKLLAAKNAGIKTVIIPAQNQRDISEISTEITDELEIIPVEHMAEVCEIAFAK